MYAQVSHTSDYHVILRIICCRCTVGKTRRNLRSHKIAEVFDDQSRPADTKGRRL